MVQHIPKMALDAPKRAQGSKRHNSVVVHCSAPPKKDSIARCLHDIAGVSVCLLMRSEWNVGVSKVGAEVVLDLPACSSPFIPQLLAVRRTEQALSALTWPSRPRPSPFCQRRSCNPGPLSMERITLPMVNHDIDILLSYDAPAPTVEARQLETLRLLLGPQTIA